MRTPPFGSNKDQDFEPYLPPKVFFRWKDMGCNVISYDLRPCAGSHKEAPLNWQCNSRKPGEKGRIVKKS